MINSDDAPESGGPAPGRWSLRLLGGFELQDLSQGVKLVLPGKRERALLAYLALSPKGRQPRRKLAAFLWGDATDETLLDNLRTCVWRLRKALGEGGHRLLASNDEDIVLDLAAFDIDVLAFRRLAGERGREELEKAAALLGGNLLDGLELDSEEFESWRRLEAARHLNQAVDVLSRLMCLYAEAGDMERAIETGATVLGLDPLNEAAARRMMKLYTASGRRGAALQLYHTLSGALQQEVSAQPEAATRQLFAAIADAEHQAAPVEAPIAVPVEARIESAPPVMPAQAPVQRSWRVPLAALAAVFVLLATLGAYRWAAPAPPAVTPGPAATPRPAATARANQGAPLTIAVLAFDNLSGNTGLQDFADGIAEEISEGLGKLPGLKLVASGQAVQLSRESGRRAIDMTPGARYLVEGEVRLTQKRVTVAARLIRTDSGAAIWSQSYDRELTDISTVRTDIAMAVTDALKAPLGLATAPQPVADPNIDPESFAQFQRARVLMRARFTGAKEAIEILAQLVKTNPHYAPAWAFLAQCYSWMPGFISPYDVAERQRRIQIFFPMAKEAAHRAIALDPGLADPYLSLSHIEAFSGHWAAAEDFAAKALALNPNSPDALDTQMTIYADVGYRKKALALAGRLHALDPDAVGWKQDTAEVLWENGQDDAAIEVLKSLVDRPSGPTSLAMMYASVGRYKDAAGVLETALKGPGTLPDTWPEAFRVAAGFLEKAPAKTALPPNPPHLDRVGFAYLYIGAPEHAFDNYEDWIKSGQTGGQGNNFSYVWNASYAPGRQTENFKRFARDAGFVESWRQRGWPDLCRPKGADDFVCD